MKVALLSLLLSYLFLLGGNTALPTLPREETPLVVAPDQVIQEVCTTCHDDLLKVGNFSLEHFDVAAPERAAEVAEKVIRKLRAGMMPPPDQPNQTSRLIPIDAQARALNEVFQKALAGTPFEHYVLVDAQWPLKSALSSPASAR